MISLPNVPPVNPARLGYRPYHLATLRTGETVEMISYAFPSDGETLAALDRIMVRDPHDPTTLREVALDDVTPTGRLA